MLLPFHLCIFRTLNDSLEIMGSGSAHKCIAPFCPQVFLTFPSFLNILRPIPSKGPVDLMVSISTKDAHISCILLPTYVVPSRWDCQTHRKSQCALLFFWTIERMTEEDPSPSPICPQKSGFEKEAAPHRKASPCNGFCKDISLMCSSEDC